MNKEKLTRAGFEPATSGLYSRRFQPKTPALPTSLSIHVVIPLLVSGPSVQYLTLHFVPFSFVM